jgi:hypothetical protein
MTSSSNFVIYLVGFLVVVGGLAWGATMAGVPPIWVGVGVIVLLGIGILSAVKRTQARSVPEDSNDAGVRRMD